MSCSLPLPLSTTTTFWDTLERHLKPAPVPLDGHHGFGAADELVVDRTHGVPPADSRLVHYDPVSSGYLITSADRIRWNTLDGVTVFPETSPWDVQLRHDPAINFHVIVQPAASPEMDLPESMLQRSGGLAFLRQELAVRDLPARARGSRGWRGPFLYPTTESSREAIVRDRLILTPTGTTCYLKELRLPDSDSVTAELRVALRVALLEDELLVSFGAKNIGARPLRVSLISFFLPLLTRGVSFHAESPWFHEGHAVPNGFFIRSSEGRIACGIRRIASAPVEHWRNLDALTYHGGPDRSAAFPAAVERGDALEHRDGAGFVAPACAHSHDRRIVGPGDDVVVHFALKADASVAATKAYLDQALTEDEVASKIATAEGRARALIDDSRLTTPSRAFSSFYQWTKQQVHGCARIQPRFRLFPNYLLGVRDKAQAAYAAVDFDPALGRALLLELSGQQFEDGRFPRQYSPDGVYDLRYFMDSGLWLPTMLVPHYLKCTADFGVLFENVGYLRLDEWDAEAKTGRVSASRRRGTVLDHLIENVEHVIRQRDPETGLVDIHDGDWNDAIGLIRGSTMVLQQLYWALAELVDLALHLPPAWRRHPSARRVSVRRYRALMDDLQETFRRLCVQRHPDGRLRILHGYTHDGRTVGGFWDSDRVATEAEVVQALGPSHRRWTEPLADRDGVLRYKLDARWVDASGEKLARLPEEVRSLFLVDRISSTPLSFAVLSGILDHRADEKDRENAALRDAIRRDVRELDSAFGWRTFSAPFGRHSRELGIGRIGDLDGAENASPYVHAGLFLCQALYRLGAEDEAGSFLDKSLPIGRALHGDQNRSVQYVPNSWGISGNNYGASMNDFHTNSAAILSRIVVEEIVGLEATYEGLVIRPSRTLPKLLSDDAQPRRVEYRAELRQRRVRIVHEWTSSVRERSMGLGAPSAEVSPVAASALPSMLVPWSALSGDEENVIFVRDPLGAEAEPA